MFSFSFALSIPGRLISGSKRNSLVPENDALFINLGRGLVVDRDALFAALCDGDIMGMLDTWYRYCPDIWPSRDPFYELPNAIMTPHCSAWVERMACHSGADAAANRDRFIRCESPVHIVAIA